MLNFWYVVNICGIVLLIVTVLLQRTSSGVLGGGTGSNVQSLLAKRGAAGLLSKMISIFAVIYFLSAILLSFLYSRYTDQYTDEINVLKERAIEELLDTELNKKKTDDQPKEDEFLKDSDIVNDGEEKKENTQDTTTNMMQDVPE